MFIQKNRPRTTVAEPIGETLAELPFTGDQAVCLGHDKAAWRLPQGLRVTCGGTFRELAYAGETPEPHTPPIPGAMHAADGVM